MMDHEEDGHMRASALDTSVVRAENAATSHVEDRPCAVGS